MANRRAPNVTDSPIRFNLMMKGEVEATTLKEPYITLTKKKGWRTICSAFYHGTGVASDKADTETYKAFNRAVCEAVRRIEPMSVYEATSRRPISTNMLAKAGSRKRSEMRVAR
jgi:hypothetical protein